MLLAFYMFMHEIEWNMCVSSITIEVDGASEKITVHSWSRRQAKHHDEQGYLE